VVERPRGNATAAAGDNDVQKSNGQKKGGSGCSYPGREVNGMPRPTTAKQRGTLLIIATRRLGSHDAQFPAR
jgi:hypothetical protein